MLRNKSAAGVTLVIVTVGITWNSETWPNSVEVLLVQWILGSSNQDN